MSRTAPRRLAQRDIQNRYLKRYAVMAYQQLALEPTPAAAQLRGDAVSVSVADTVFIASGDYSLAVDLAGDPAAPPVVLLHGIPGWRGTWHPVARRLATNAYVVAPDLAGFGQSSEAPAHFHAADQAELIVCLIRRLGLRPVHLVGFDFGGPTAVMVYKRAPELVATLTLAATNVLTDTPIPLPLQLVRLPLIGNLIARLLFGRFGLTMMWFAAVARRDRFRLADFRAILQYPQGVTSTRRIFQISLRDLPGVYGPVRAALSEIRVPCTVAWGDRDPFFPMDVGMRTAAEIPGARFVQLKGVGHFLPAEDPDGLAGMVTAAIEDRATTGVSR